MMLTSRTVTSRLVATTVPPEPAGAVLVLHGGAARRAGMAVSPTQLSVLRMIPIAERIAHAGQRKLAVYRLLNSARGWDNRHTPVDDVHWALGQLRKEFAETLPICLVGHSLGGRAALLAADLPPVHSAVALAPWLYPTDGDLDLSGRKILIVHGAQDRIAKPKNSAAVARSLGRTAQVSYVRIAGGKHAMLKHGRVFDRLAADFSVATLLGGAADGLVGRALAGEQWIDA
jgi:pimeloyl-ACP methyl ester carboxylesterase